MCGSQKWGDTGISQKWWVYMEKPDFFHGWKMWFKKNLFLERPICLECPRIRIVNHQQYIQPCKRELPLLVMGKNDVQNKLTSPFWMIKHIQYPFNWLQPKKTNDILSQTFRINSFTLYNCHLSMDGPKMDMFFSCHKFPPPHPKKKKKNTLSNFPNINKKPTIFLGYPPLILGTPKFPF